VSKASAIVFLMLASLSWPVHAEPADLRAGGTGAATELLQQLTTAFSKQAGGKPEIIASLGTTGGLRALADGQLDLAASGRALKPEERARGLKVATVVRTPFVLATSHKNPAGLRAADLVKAYLDPDYAWSDGTPIRVILRPRSESDVALMGSLFPGLGTAMEKTRERPGIPVAATDQDNADLAEKIPGSLVGTTLTQLVLEKRDLRVVPIDGHNPTAESLRDGSYPYAKSLYFVTREQPGEGVLAFLRFLASEQGQALLHKALVVTERIQ
jgi:phosphate transport system substrate-binding protein